MTMELDIFEDLIGAVNSVLEKASTETQKAIEPEIVGIIELSRSRRNHEFLMGKHLCRIRICLAQEDAALGEELNRVLGLVSKHSYMTMRLYQRFASHERYIGLITGRVQRYFADHTYSPEMLKDVVALAQEGREITMPVFKSEVLTKYQTLTEDQLVEDPPGDDDVFPMSDDLAVDDDDVDPWDEEDESIPVTAATAGAEPVVAASERSVLPIKGELVDLMDKRTKLIRNMTEELSGAIRSIDEFCRSYNTPRGQWFQKFRNGADLILEGIREWERIEIKQKKG